MRGSSTPPSNTNPPEFIHFAAGVGPCVVREQGYRPLQFPQTSIISDFPVLKVPFLRYFEGKPLVELLFCSPDA
jgi:hypothetical protein